MLRHHSSIFSRILKSSFRNGWHDESLLLHYLSNGWHDDARNLLQNSSGGDLHSHVVRWTSLLSNFSRHGFVAEARTLFDIMPYRNLVSYNAMLSAYLRSGMLDEASRFFDTMPERNVVSWTVMLGGFSDAGRVASTCMIAGYLSAGQVLKAWNLFNDMPDRDSIAWTEMIYGYVQNELIAEAFCLFVEMMAHGVSPMSSTYAVLFGAMGSVAYLDQGRQLHGMQLKTVYVYDLILENSLIAMYAKCGEIDDAYRIFSNMTYRDKISWNTMIMGLSDHGMANKALKVYETMLEFGIYPDGLTFLGVLTACAHAGLVDKGWELFLAMVNAYAIQPGLEHYVSIINLLGRAGKVKEAEEFVLRLPVEPNHAIWGALIGVCGFSKTNADVARRAAKRLFELEPLNAPGHVVLCNIYAANDRHIEDTSLRKEMRMKGVRKAPGCSWILVRGAVHIFFSDNKLHLRV
ncbi:Pentatricopeptide repeat-containing protein, mitochondrial [Glycine soja]|nr:Pentatricopeptide repeat-containing protein, mitochondrial [Glycine soja]